MSEIEVKLETIKQCYIHHIIQSLLKGLKISDARWNSGEKCWTIDESNLDAARVIMKESTDMQIMKLMKRSHSKFM